MVRLREERLRLALVERAERTRRAYAADWRDFEAWCKAAGRPALPAASETVELYLVDLAGKGRKVSTLRRRVAAIAYVHEQGGRLSPVGPSVRGVLAAIARRYGTAARGAAAVTPDDLRRMVAGLGDGARDRRDRALLLLGFAGGFRRGELVALDTGDVEFVDGAGLRVLVRRSKTDQEGVGRWVGVFRGQHEETCPVRAFRRWLVVRGDWPGPVFCPVGRGGTVRRERLGGASVRLAVRRAAARAGLEPGRYTAHSLRAGMVTAAVQAGAAEVAVMLRTGHRSRSTLQRYVRPVEVLAVDPLAGVL